MPDCRVDRAAAPSGRSVRRIEGRVLGGRYRVGKLIGSGAMGRVYTAKHVELGRACAVKVIREPEDGAREDASASDVEDAIARFRVEALAASRLDHPNVMRVLDFGSEPDGLWYLVTERLDGRDLIDVIADVRMSTSRIVAIMRQVCSALQHAHERGVIHRDVKPENVRLVPRVEDDGRDVEHVKLMDFGTAIVSPAGPGLPHEPPPSPREKLVVGTPAYMSPEQALGQAVDHRSDLYACGVVLFEMATGRLPFERPSPIALAAAHVECRPPVPSSINEAVDPELESIILWCLRKKPAERPNDARALRNALGRVAARVEPVEARPARIDTKPVDPIVAERPRSPETPIAPIEVALARPRPARRRAAAIVALAAALAIGGCAATLARSGVLSSPIDAVHGALRTASPGTSSYATRSPTRASAPTAAGTAVPPPPLPAQNAARPFAVEPSDATSSSEEKPSPQPVQVARPASAPSATAAPRTSLGGADAERAATSAAPAHADGAPQWAWPVDALDPYDGSAPAADDREPNARRTAAPHPLEAHDAEARETLDHGVARGTGAR